MGFRCVALALSVSLLVVENGRSAFAASAADAEVFVKRGIELRKQFKDREALEEFQRAYQLAQTPRIAAQMGTAEQAVGRWVDAEVHVSEALAATRDAWIAKNRPALEEALTTIRTHLGTLEIFGSPTGADVRIDGREVGKVPLAKPQRVAAGSVVIEMRAAGYFPMSRTVSVPVGKLTRETVMLPPADAARGSAEIPNLEGRLNVARSPEAAGSGPPGVATATGQEMEATRSVPSPPTEARTTDDGTAHGSWQRPLAWTLLVGAGAFAGGGVAALVVRNNKANDYNRRVEANACGGSNASVCADLKSSGNRAGTLAVVGFGIASTMVITSTILFLTTPGAPTSATTAMRGCSIDGTSAARLLVCGFLF